MKALSSQPLSPSIINDRKIALARTGMQTEPLPEKKRMIQQRNNEIRSTAFTFGSSEFGIASGEELAILLHLKYGNPNFFWFELNCPYMDLYITERFFFHFFEVFLPKDFLNILKDFPNSLVQKGNIHYIWKTLQNLRNPTVKHSFSFS